MGPFRAMRPSKILVITLVVVLLLGVAGLLTINHAWPSFNAVNLGDSYVVKPSDVLPSDAVCTDSKASLANLNGPFKFDDAVSSPLASRDAKKPADAFTELKKRICDEVGTGVAHAEMFNAKEVTLDGKKFGDTMPWIREFIAKAKDGGLVKAFWTKDLLTGQIVTTDEYRKYASMINALLDKFPAPAIKAGDYSVANWHVVKHKRIKVQDVVKNTDKVTVPMAVRNPDYQENRTALWFTAIDKAGNCHLVVGTDVWDKRPLIGKCKTNPSTSPPTSPPTPPTRPPTSPPPGKVPVCSPDGKHIIYVPKKDAHKYKKPFKKGSLWLCSKPNDDPSQHGNAGNGGGRNQDPGPGPTTTPTTVPTAPHTNPAPPPATDAPRPSPAPTKELPSDPPATGKPVKP